MLVYESKVDFNIKPSNTLFIIGGVPGGGKSTYTYNTFSSSNIKVLDQDKRAVEVYGDYSFQSYRKAGEDIVNTLKNWDINNGSLVWETALNSKFFDRVIKMFKSKGFFIDLTYIFVDVEIYANRIKKRQNNGGHGIPADVLERRIKKRMENFYQAMLCSNHWRMLYSHTNTETNKPEFKMIGHGREDDNGIILNNIYNDDLFNNFHKTRKTRSKVR